MNHHRKYEVYKEKKKKKLRAKPSEIIKKLQKIRMGEVSKTSEVTPAIPPPIQEWEVLTVHGHGI